MWNNQAPCACKADKVCAGLAGRIAVKTAKVPWHGQYLHRTLPARILYLVFCFAASGGTQGFCRTLPCVFRQPRLAPPRTDPERNQVYGSVTGRVCQASKQCWEATAYLSQLIRGQKGAGGPLHLGGLPVSAFPHDAGKYQTSTQKYGCPESYITVTHSHEPVGFVLQQRTV